MCRGLLPLMYALRARSLEIENVSSNLGVGKLTITVLSGWSYGIQTINLTDTRDA